MSVFQKAAVWAAADSVAAFETCVAESLEHESRDDVSRIVDVVYDGLFDRDDCLSYLRTLIKHDLLNMRLVMSGIHKAFRLLYMPGENNETRVVDVIRFLDEQGKKFNPEGYANERVWALFCARPKELKNRISSCPELFELEQIAESRTVWSLIYSIGNASGYTVDLMKLLVGVGLSGSAFNSLGLRAVPYETGSIADADFFIQAGADISAGGYEVIRGAIDRNRWPLAEYLIAQTGQDWQTIRSVIKVNDEDGTSLWDAYEAWLGRKAAPADEELMDLLAIPLLAIEAQEKQA